VSSIYLDNHATTPVDPAVLDAMLPFFTEHFGNAASINHEFGWKAGEAVDEARAQVAGLLNTDPRAVVFTSGATEANNLVIKGVMHAAGPGSHLITNEAEHRAVLDPSRRLKRMGHEVSILPVDRFGQIQPSEIVEAIKSNTALVSVMMANNEVGTINNVAEIAEICQRYNVKFHSDAVQAVGKLPIDLKQTPIDLLSISAHKIYGPKGVGALIVRRGKSRTALTAQIDGGGHENQLRSGTLPVPLIVGFGRACVLAAELRVDEGQRIEQLRNELWGSLQSRLEGIQRNGHHVECLSGNLNISVEGIDGEALMNAMSSIAVSSGSACTSADPEPSHVLTAMGVPDQLCRASLRVGIGRFNSSTDIVQASNVVVDAVQRLRSNG